MSVKDSKLINLKLSAPGKVILFGEHSVVYHKPAIAAALDLRTKLHFVETASGLIRLHFPPVNIDESFTIDQVRNYFRFPSDLAWDEYFKLLTKKFESFCDDLCIAPLTDSQKLSLITFFHCISDLPETCSGFELKIDSELAVGSGVGSSASFSVVLSAAFLLHRLIRNSPDLITRNEDNSVTITEELKKLISEASLSCEKIIHGRPSGIDHNTVLHGSMVAFVKAESESNLSFLQSSSIRILLVNTNVPRSTKVLVENVRKLKEKHSDIVEGVLDAMGCLAKSAILTLRDLKVQKDECSELETKLGELINLNHDLLRVLGVSHDSLENICSIASQHGLTAKLTGAGGGGNGFVFIPKSTESAVVDIVKNELTAAGFSVTEATLGGPGLTIDELTY